MPLSRVLVADDVSANRLLFSVYLKRDYEVVTVETAEQALEALCGGGFDAALLDLNYQGGMTGFDLIQRIRATKAIASTPTLALTAHASADDRIECLGAGFDAYLSKPVLRDEMLTAVRDLLGGAAG